MFLTKAVDRSRTRRKAQGMTEYILIVALIAVAAIGVVTLFGNNLRRIFGASNDALAGEQDKETMAKKTMSNLLDSKTTTTFNSMNKPE